MWVPAPCRRRTLSRPLARDHDVAPLCKRGWAARFRLKTLRSASSLICCVPAQPVGRMTASSQPCSTAVPGRREAPEARRDHPCASGRTIVQDLHIESYYGSGALRDVFIKRRGANGEVVPAENGVVRVC